MQLILLSGGTGKRLWPLSNNSRSKQFLKILENEQGNKESMVQRVYNQLSSIGMSDSCHIITNGVQAGTIESQLGENAKVIVEPEQKDTFAAISLAVSYLHSVLNVPLDETIVIAPVDPFVDITYFDKMRDLDHVLNISGVNLVLMGVTPTHPSDQYGYIVSRSMDKFSNISLVDKFVEKPSTEVAEDLLNNGALWNCGVFAFKLGYMMSQLRDKGIPTSYQMLKKRYKDLPKISFDYEVVEKETNIATISYDGNWKDLGTWEMLLSEVKDPVLGKGIVDEECNNVQIINELDIPIAVIGLSDVLVASSPDGILVTTKEQSAKIKNLVNGMNLRPMYEERKWGDYKILESSKTDNNEVLTKKVILHAGKNLSYHYHAKRIEVWTIISGEGEIILNGKKLKVAAGNTFHIPPNTRHAIKAISTLEFIEVAAGPEIVEDDVVRLELEWDKILRAYVEYNAM